MIHLLPRWVWTGAWALAFIAGIVNVVGFLGFEHQAITHLTGTASLLSAALGLFDRVLILRVGAGLFAFILGTTISGFIIEDSVLKLGSRYSFALLIESSLLIAAVPLMKQTNMYGYYLASCACGLQNAMATTYSGSVVRTTHLSGMFTDLGIALGHLLRGKQFNTRRVRLSLVVITGFISGGITGTLLYDKYSYNTLYLPAAFTGIVAVVYHIVSDRYNAKKN